MALKVMNLSEIAQRYGVTPPTFRKSIEEKEELIEMLEASGFIFKEHRLFYPKQIEIIEDYYGKMPDAS